MHDIGTVEVTPTGHLGIGRRFDRNLIPGAVAGVEESDVVERSVRQGITSEHPQRASTIGRQGVAETGQSLAEVLQVLRQMHRVEQFDEDELFTGNPKRNAILNFIT